MHKSLSPSNKPQILKPLLRLNPRLSVACVAFCAFMLSLLPISSNAQSVRGLTNTRADNPQSRQACNGAFEEDNGLVIIETESATQVADWSLRTDIAGSTGSGYFEWKHGDTSMSLDNKGTGTLTYRVKITQTGTYRFLFRSAAPHTTEHNDSWLRFRDNDVEAKTDAGDSFDLGQDTWFKVFQGKGGDEWNFAAHVEGDPHQVYPSFTAPGEYRMELSGRSTQFKIDRLVLFHSSVSWGVATNLNTSESSCLLPVELTSFDGIVDGDEVVLNWTTASELNNAGFDVEFSHDANGAFTQIGFAAGQGTSDENQSYQFRHAFAGFAGQTVYYRLKQVDFDGAFEYSDVVAVNLPSSTTALLHQAYPNPFNPTTNISFTLPKDGQIQLTVYDEMGRQIKTLIDGIMQAGYHTKQFEASNLASGTYMYRLVTPSQTLTGTVLLLR